jgi:hypothetical protein
VTPDATESFDAPVRSPRSLSRWIDVQLLAMLAAELTGPVSDDELTGGSDVS